MEFSIIWGSFFITRPLFETIIPFHNFHKAKALVELVLRLHLELEIEFHF